MLHKSANDWQLSWKLFLVAVVTNNTVVRQNKCTPTTSALLLLLSIDDTIFLPGTAIRRLIRKSLRREIMFAEGILCRGGEFSPREFLARDPFCQGGVFTGTYSVASETDVDAATAKSGRVGFQRECLIWDRLCQYHWRQKHLVAAAGTCMVMAESTSVSVLPSCTH